MTLEQRILAALGNDVQKSVWEKLIAVFQGDREAFFLLADEVNLTSSDAAVRELSNLAKHVRAAIHETYDIVPTTSGATLRTFSGTETDIPKPLVSEVARFLREIDGKTTSLTAGKDYEGESISDAEVRFRLGDASTWERERQELQAWQKLKPQVFRVDLADIANLSFQPPYVTYALLDCGRRTVLNPTGVFRGLQRGEGACEDVRDGWAICGKPRHAVGNDGIRQPAPANMVFMVFADKDGYVFDWDWVEENPDEPGCPINRELRFGNPHPMDGEAFLELPTDLKPGNFDPSKACYSERGDCIFCYIADDVAFAQRINADLTVFRKLGSDRITGFKVKNLTRILKEDRSIILKDAPDLTVSVRGALLATLKGHKDTQVKVYEVIIEAWKTASESPRVQVPRSRLPKGLQPAS